MWSLVSPTACMKECIIVGPTYLNPFFTISLLIVSDFDVFTGILLQALYCVLMGLLLTNPHRYLWNDPNCFFISKILLELSTTPLTWLNSTPYSMLVEFIFFSLYFATISASNPENASLEQSKQSKLHLKPQRIGCVSNSPKIIYIFRNSKQMPT
uniref:Putative ovule protein n=1 Tax=Solanum chacoense TaxID=4108 RepID=A0A0V0I280_SOLCH